MLAYRHYLAIAMPFQHGMLFLLLQFARPGHALDNGLAQTPPRGWRSWNAYDCTSEQHILTQAHMEAQMAAVLDRSRLVDGKFTSLAELGFDWISMDDGWQECNCSVRQDLNASKPPCPNLCFGGHCTFHGKDGKPMVRKDRFPAMKALVNQGHELGLKVGSYLNTCICMEAGKSPTHYELDVQWMQDNGFDEVKVDACGNAHNLTLWAELFNKTGKPVRIENCHNSWPDFNTGYCPMNFYRTGGDISADIGSIIGEAYSTVDASDLPHPRSGPGCWGYPDMSEVGNFAPGMNQLNMERSHWGLWCVISSPLILGFDMNNTATMDRVWPIITNTDALAVSKAWAGHPGTLIKVYQAMNQGFQIAQGECDASPATRGWHFEDGNFIAPTIDGMLESHCVNANGDTPCPPPTTRSSDVQCGKPVSKCPIKPSSRWTFANKTIQWSNGNPSDKPQCLGAFPKNFDTSKGYFTRQAAQVKMQGCATLAAMPRGSSCTTARPGVGVHGEQLASSAKDSNVTCGVTLDACCAACDGDATCTAYLWRKHETQTPASCHSGKSYCWLLASFHGTHAAGHRGGTFGSKAPVKLEVGLLASQSYGSFTLTVQGELRTSEGKCLTVVPINGVHLWAKPLSEASVAIFLMNTLNAAQNLSFPLTDVPSFPGTTLQCVPGDCTARNVWLQKDMAITLDHISLELKPYESAFLILRQQKTQIINV